MRYRLPSPGSVHRRSASVHHRSLHSPCRLPRVVRRIAERFNHPLEGELQIIRGNALGAVGREPLALGTITVEVPLLQLVQLQGFSKLFAERLLRCLELDDPALRAPKLGAHCMAGGAFRQAQGG
jgi:hypothetical protein